jgi:cysteine sulfinate desulfinase/cysteine desulfurase-like protein
MGLPIERARSAVRFSLGKWTTADEIEATGDAVQKIVERLQTRKSEYAVA